MFPCTVWKAVIMQYSWRSQQWELQIGVNFHRCNISILCPLGNRFLKLSLLTKAFLCHCPNAQHTFFQTAEIDQWACYAMVRPPVFRMDSIWLINNSPSLLSKCKALQGYHHLIGSHLLWVFSSHLNLMAIIIQKKMVSKMLAHLFGSKLNV